MNDLKSRKEYINTNCERKYPGVKDYYLRCVSDEVVDRLRKESLYGVCFLSLSDLREAYNLTKSEGLKVMLLIDDEPDIQRKGWHKNLVEYRIQDPNEMKSITAGKKQLEDIQWIETYRTLDSLPEKLQHVAYARKQLPEASLNELCEYCAEEFNETISKSGMKHRLAKLRELADQYRKE